MQRDAIDFGSDNIPKLFGKMLMPTRGDNIKFIIFV